MLTTSWNAEPAASANRPSTSATLAKAAAGTVVTEMNTPTSDADFAEVSANIPAAPASSAAWSFSASPVAMRSP